MTSSAAFLLVGNANSNYEEQVSKQIALFRADDTIKGYMSREKALRRVAVGRYTMREDGCVQEIESLNHMPVICGFTDGPMGVGNLLPFAKIQNKLRAPAKLHYSIPACGAHNPPPVTLEEMYG